MFDALCSCLMNSSFVAKETKTLEDWSSQWRSLTRENREPVALAMYGGFRADRVAWAFCSGYQAALRSLMMYSTGEPGPDELLAFCATESGGNRPRDIATTFTGEGADLCINGEKSWSALGAMATTLIVVGRRPSDDEQPQLEITRVPSTAQGVTFIEKPPLPYAPEMVHTACRFDNVKPASIDGFDGSLFHGDGYSFYVKPFRTVEDIFVSLAVQGWLLREALARNWPEAFREQLLAQLTTLYYLSDEDPRLPTTHMPLAGALAATRRIYEQADELWRGESDAAAERWRRDRPLFDVASKPRALRAQRAWEALAAGLMA